MQKLPVTEKDISQTTDAPIFSPILCASLDYFDLPTEEFLAFYRPSFAHMPWDLYDVKRRQWEAMPPALREGQEADFKAYYLDSGYPFSRLAEQLKLPSQLVKDLTDIAPWRRRSVCAFELEMGEKIDVQRVPIQAFEQELATEDIRSWPRAFAETEREWVDQALFYDFLRAVAQYAQKVTPHIDIQKLKITAHFMSVKARPQVPGNNSPEGAHEDGADFIISALVINRENILQGKSQVFEKLANEDLVNVFERELQAGEFLFQADTGEEKHYGNDLWHYVTPFHVAEGISEAWRDIIGLDIIIESPKT